jgi:hypothetical protein
VGGLRKNAPREENMKTDEMTSILEQIIRDESTNPTARCTAIRTLRQIEQDPGSDELADELARLIATDDEGP